MAAARHDGTGRLLAFNFPVILPVLARQTFHDNGGTYGLLSTMLSVGLVAGSLGVGGRVSIAGVACYRPGDRPHLFYHLLVYRRRTGEPKGFAWCWITGI